jgi:Putative beta-barrel porin 2
MLKMRRPWSALIGVAAAALALAGASSTASAQVGAFGGTAGPTLVAPATTITDHPDVLAQPSRDYSALVLGDWLLYPSAFVGGIFDSNPDQLSSGGKSSAGIRLVPSLLAETTNGISKTSLYGMVDGQIYTNNGSGSTDTVAAKAGVIENYEIAPDLLLSGQGDFTRQKDLFSTFGLDHSVTTLNPTGIGLAPVASPVTYNQYSGTASVLKNFDRAFVSLGGTAVGIDYDHTSGAPSPNGVDTTETLRGGYWLNPVLYGYVEGSVDQRNYSISGLSSNGYRVLGGLGSDQIGLFRGQIYAGYQTESYNASAIGNVSAPVFGGAVYYYPLPQVTLAASVDETLGASLLSASAGAPGTATRVTDALAQATYSVMQEWAASRDGDAWLLGGTLSYSVWQNLGLTLDYQHIQSSSNVVGQSFDRDVVTVGLTYKY